MSNPNGWEPFAEIEGYIAHNGPYLVRTEADGTYRYGFQTDERHSNPNNVIHGAAVTGFADTVLGHIIVHSLKRNCATISLTTEFISGAPLGSFIEATAQVKRATRTLAFVSTDVTFEGKLLLSATGVYRLFEEK